MSLQTYIESYQVFSEEEIQEVLPLFECKHLAQFEHLVKAGEVCEELAFIESGVFHSYHGSPDLDEATTYCINFPNNISFAYSSFITEQASKENIQAITPATVWTLQKSTIKSLAHQKITWANFFRIIAERQYVELEERLFEFQNYDAKQRYELILEQNPECIQQAPLKYLASYLGITQRHLSRIRREISF